MRIVDRIELAVGAGEYALTILLLHYVALGGEGDRFHSKARHPVRLGEEQPLEVVGGDLPLGSSLEPTSYQTCTDTLGVEASRIANTRRPLASVRWV